MKLLLLAPIEAVGLELIAC